MDTLQRLFASTAVGCALLAASPALADLDAPALEMSVLRNGVLEWWDLPPGTQPDTSHSGTTWMYQEQYHSHSGWGIEYDALIDTDPSISLGFSFTNNTGSTQMFSVSVMLPIADIAGDTVMGGSVGGSTTDSDRDGAGGVSAPSPGAFYNALINGSVVRTLHDDPFSVGYGFAGATTNIPADDFGLPGPTEPAPTVVESSIGIRIDFILSAGDTVSASSFFVLEPVPAPGALALLGFAGVMGTRRRRRS